MIFQHSIKQNTSGIFLKTTQKSPTKTTGYTTRYTTVYTTGSTENCGISIFQTSEILDSYQLISIKYFQHYATAMFLQ